jgi:cell division protein ZapA
MSTDNNKTLKIHLVIGGFRFPMTINREDEELYRRAEKLAVNCLEEYQKQYPQRSSEELLTLVAFRLAVATSKLHMSQDVAPLAEKMKAFDAELEELFKD